MIHFVNNWDRVMWCCCYTGGDTCHRPVGPPFIMRVLVHVTYPAPSFFNLMMHHHHSLLNRVATNQSTNWLEIHHKPSGSQTYLGLTLWYSHHPFHEPNCIITNQLLILHPMHILLCFNFFLILVQKWHFKNSFLILKIPNKFIGHYRTFI